MTILAVLFEVFSDVGLENRRVFGTSARAAFAQSMSFCTVDTEAAFPVL
jgi:hypothetical protein